VANLIKPWVTYNVDAAGRRVKAGTPGAVQVREQLTKWYAESVPGWPRGKRVPLATHRATAQAMLNRLVEDAIRGRAGLADRYAAHRDRPLADHLDDFAGHLRAKDKSPKHVRQTTNRVRAILKGCKFERVDDLSDLLLGNWLADERAAGRIGPKTSNYYLRDMKQFLRWMARGRMEKGHPCLDVEPVRAGHDIRRARRELAVPELLAVFDAARGSAVAFRGMTGADRYHLYLTACGTGFRVQELASLTPESFRLDDRPPTATVKGRIDKRRRKATQPLPAGVVSALRDYLRGKRPGERIWPKTWWRRAAEMLQLDLTTAGVPYSVPGPDGTPLYADFHALRHTFITYLANAGVSPKVAQEMARHSDIRLTMNVYTHASADAMADAANRLALPAAGSTPANPLATLSRDELEALCAALLPAAAAWESLHTDGHTDNSAPAEDSVGLPGTEGADRRRPVKPKKLRIFKGFGRSGTG
jgi:integrase